MKRLLILCLVFLNLAAFGQTTVTADRIVANRGFYLKDRWVDSIGGDTSMQGEIRSLPSSDAVYRMVAGRLAALQAALQFSLNDSTSVLRDSINALRADLASGGGGASLPSMTGNAGKVLTTDGTTASWTHQRKYYNVVDYGATPNDNSDDDTDDIQEAINAAHAAGGGVVYFPLGIYHLSGALQTSISSTNPNSQLYIPLSTSGTSMVRVKLLGEAPPQWASEVIANASRNTKGVILKSTITGSGTRPSVIGTPYYAMVFGDFNYTYVDLENLVIETRTKTGATHIAPTMSGVNFEKAVAATFANICVQTESTPADLVNPTGTGTYGIYLPGVNNKAVVKMDGTCKVEGFEYGVVMSEHANAEDLIVDGCVKGVVLKSGYHANTISHAKLEGNVYNISCDGTTTLNIHTYDTEHYIGSEFYSFSKDIQQVSGASKVYIFTSQVTKSNVGNTDEFVADAVTYRVFNGHGENVTYGGGSAAITPDPPTAGVVDDDANTFDWTNSASYTAVGDYEYTTNAGSSYTTATAKPVAIGNVDLAAGQVGVRVKAATGRNQSTTLYSTAPFTSTGTGGTVYDDATAYYAFEDASGDFTDGSGNALSLTRSGVTTEAGKVSNAARFTAASSQYLQGPASNLYSANTGLTVAFWVKVVAETGTDQVLIGKWGASGSMEYSIAYNQGSVNATISTDGTNATFIGVSIDPGSAQALSLGTWYFVVVKWDGTELTIRVNDQAPVHAGQTTAAATIYKNGAGAFHVGRLYNNSLFANAAIDELGIWNRSLTAEEITYLYNAGSGRTK